MPSIAPPTDEIDSEWGAEDIPAPAKVPELAAQPAPAATATPSSPPRPASVPAPRPSSTPAPRPSSSPAPRPSASPATSTPLVYSPATSTPLINPPAASNPLRKQTLLGIAPVIPPRSEPPAAAAPSEHPPAPEPPPVAPSQAPAAAGSQPPLVASSNPLRKQTLLGLAPVIPSPPKSEPPAATPAEAATEPVAAQTATEPADAQSEAPFEPAGSVPSLQTPALVATDAPTTSDLPGEAEPVRPKRSEPKRAEPARAAVSLSDDDLPPIKQSKPRWLLPVGAAAAIALGVIGLRSLDRAPTAVPAELAHPHTPSKAASKALGAAPKSDDEGDDDDDDPSEPPQHGSDDTPDPTPPDPDPLKAKAAAANTAAAPAPSAAAPSDAAPSAAAPAPSAAPAATGDAVHVNVTSDPPGARMFWKGKEVGTTPFVLELQPGEKHAYELGKVGFTTRKVVIDGSKTEISIGLRPDPGSGFGSSR